MGRIGTVAAVVPILLVPPAIDTVLYCTVLYCTVSKTTHSLHIDGGGLYQKATSMPPVPLVLTLREKAESNWPRDVEIDFCRQWYIIYRP